MTTRNPTLTESKSRILTIVDDIAPDLTDIAKYLFDHPETAYQEQQACQRLTDYLQANGFNIQSAPGGIDTAFIARPQPGGANGHPKIAFLAEYDALPKIGHGCGHNLIAAASMGAAVAFSRACPEMAGAFQVIGTPAEEGGGGKAKLADAGVFDNIDMALMFHPGQFNFLGTPTLGRIKATAAFHGRSAHAAASPEQGRNALDAMVGAYNHISAMRQQLPPDARIHGIITHGGEAPNVIPDYAAGRFFIRSLNKDYLQVLFKKFEDCCQGAALASGCQCEITIEPPSLEPMKRNHALENVWHQNMKLLNQQAYFGQPAVGSTDLGNISQRLPVIQPFLSICPPEVSFHTPEFALATQSPQGTAAMLTAAKLLALTAVDYLASPSIQQAAALEFAQN